MAAPTAGPPTVSPGGDTPRLSLVMPCYNEEAIVAQTVRRLLQEFERAEIPVEIITVDNGSRDDTLGILHGLAEVGPRDRAHPFAFVAAFAPARRPNTTHSRSELPIMRFRPWVPPAISPHAKTPSRVVSAPVSITRPPFW